VDERRAARFENLEAQMKATKTIWLTLLTLWLACAGPAFAQTDRGNITGTVTDPSGAVVSGAKVTATNLETNEVRETNTTDEGNFTLTELKAGPWKVNVEAQGFKTTTIEKVNGRRAGDAHRRRQARSRHHRRDRQRHLRAAGDSGRHGRAPE
jgi:hypothetical protein